MLGFAHVSSTLTGWLHTFATGVVVTSWGVPRCATLDLLTEGVEGLCHSRKHVISQISFS
mgnify:CR=1 FL=1